MTMSLLRDEELIAAITAQPPAARYVEGVVLPADPYSKDSPVQASSIDLHVGNIYLPGSKDSEEGGANNPKSDHVLLTGETAVVTTKEILHLPGDVAGVGFPPSRVSFKGLLMTNPGHVDPGYDGLLRFTVINMAKEAYPLINGDRIVTLLLYKMNAGARSDWRQRNPGGGNSPSPVNHANINRLARDFVDVVARAKKVARDEGVKIGLAITSGLAVLRLILQALISSQTFYRKDMEDIKKRQDLVEYDIKNRVNVDKKLEEFDNRLKELKRSNQSSGTSQKQVVVKPTPKVPGKP
jgi:deoxycytidine triphosphate deaminase